MAYGILKIGYGKKVKYTLRKLIANGSETVTGKVWKSIESAQAEAGSLNIEIIGVGDNYELLAMNR